MSFHWSIKMPGQTIRKFVIRFRRVSFRKDQSGGDGLALSDLVEQHHARLIVVDELLQVLDLVHVGLDVDLIQATDVLR